MNFLAKYVNEQQGADAAEDKKFHEFCWQTHRNCTCYYRTLNAQSCKMLGLTPAIKSLTNSSPVLGSQLIRLRTLFLLSSAHCLHFSELFHFLLITVWQIIAPNCLFKDTLKNKPLSFRRKLLQLHTVMLKIPTGAWISH